MELTAWIRENNLVLETECSSPGTTLSSGTTLKDRGWELTHDGTGQKDMTWFDITDVNTTPATCIVNVSSKNPNLLSRLLNAFLECEGISEWEGISGIEEEDEEPNRYINPFYKETAAGEEIMRRGWYLSCGLTLPSGNPNDDEFLGWINASDTSGALLVDIEITTPDGRYMLCILNSFLEFHGIPAVGEFPDIPS